MASKYFKAFNLFKGKVSPTIKSVKPNVPKTKGQKLKRDLKLATQKSKTSRVKLDKAIFDLQEQNRQFKKDRIKKMGGGFMGKRMGYSDGSGLKDIPPGKKFKGLRMLPKEVRNKMKYKKDGGKI